MVWHVQVVEHMTANPEVLSSVHELKTFGCPLNSNGHLTQIEENMGGWAKH